MRKNYGSWTSSQRCSARVKSRVPISQVGKVLRSHGIQGAAEDLSPSSREMPRERHHTIPSVSKLLLACVERKTEEESLLSTVIYLA